MARKKQHKTGVDTDADDTQAAGATDDDAGDDLQDDSEPVEEAVAPEPASEPKTPIGREEKQQRGQSESQGSQSYADMMRVKWKPKRRRR